METRGALKVSSAAAAGALSLTLLVSGGSAGAADDHPGAADAGHATFRQTNLIADRPGHAETTDPNLVNPWGVSYGATTPLWVSDNGTGVSTLYSGGIHGGPQRTIPLVVNLPGGTPTGQVFNPTTQFVVHGRDGSSAPALFLFAGESGHITGWAPTVPLPAPSTNAQDAVVTPGAVDKGLAIASIGTQARLYAADFSAGTVDVYDGSFRRVITSGNFADRRLPAGFAPFNVAVLDGRVYVAYARQDAKRHDEVDGAGLGRVDVFTLDGHLIHRLSQSGQLNAPWGLTIAPEGFGRFSGDLLVGNFGDGRIHAFDARTLAPRGVLTDEHHRPITIDGLWALTPGNGTEAAPDEVLFTAGPDHEAHGLVGTLRLHH